MTAPAGRRRPVVELRKVSKIYGSGDTIVRAVDGVDLVVERGDYVAVMGASGSGKSTLMNIIGCLDVPTRGRYLLDGVDIRRLDERRQAIVRNRKIGFIFQSFNLIPRTTASSNVELPLAYAGVKPAERRRRSLMALEQIGLAGRAHHLPSQLSGGQQQRVAIARAIVTNPVMLLADEPTGALDSRSTAEVLALFDDLNADGRTVVVITHEAEVAHHAKRVVRMRDGRIQSDERVALVDAVPPQLAERSAGAGTVAPTTEAVPVSAVDAFQGSDAVPDDARVVAGAELPSMAPRTGRTRPPPSSTATPAASRSSCSGRAGDGACAFEFSD
jgi:putative ABC transport system ATP-binding protein